MPLPPLTGYRAGDMAVRQEMERAHRRAEEYTALMMESSGLMFERIWERTALADETRPN